VVELSPATTRRLDALFRDEDRGEATRLLREECAENIPLWFDPTSSGLDRLRIAAIKLSEGDLAKLRRAVEIAHQDWRDVLVAAGFGNDVTAHERWMP
jgi:hypothetical protein